MNYSPALVIDPEFKALIPALSPEEYAQLEQNILAEGCKDALVTWEPIPFGDEILLDGHNRLEICRKHDYEFWTRRIGPKIIPDRAAALAWIINNQLGRRNLHPDQASYLRGKRYNGEKQDKGGDRKSIDQNDLLIESTASRLAAEYKVGPATITRDGQFAAAVDELANANAITPNEIICHAPKQAIVAAAKSADGKGLVEKLALLAKMKEEARATKKANKEREKTDPYWISYNAWYPVLNAADTLAEGIAKVKASPILPLHEKQSERLRRLFNEFRTFYEDYLGVDS